MSKFRTGIIRVSEFRYFGIKVRIIGCSNHVRTSGTCQITTGRCQNCCFASEFGGRCSIDVNFDQISPKRLKSRKICTPKKLFHLKFMSLNLHWLNNVRCNLLRVCSSAVINRSILLRSDLSRSPAIKVFRRFLPEGNFGSSARFLAHLEMI